MSSNDVTLWRRTPVAVDADSATADIDRAAIFPSARQGLDAIVGAAGLGRRAYVGIPDFASHCVADFLSRRATTVPLRFLPVDEAGAVLVYDQWGWQRPAGSFAAAQQRYPRAIVIWDRVDSLPDDFESAARNDAGDGVWQLFSLSKTLGAGGGGLVWREKSGWMRPRLGEQGPFGSALAAWAQSSALAGDEERTQIDLFLRKELAAWPPALRTWLSAQHVGAAAGYEARARGTRLQATMQLLQPRLPEWMHSRIGERGPAPGILPVPLRSADPGLLGIIRRETGLDLCFYHFDFSDSYVESQWVQVLPVPLHSEVQVSALERLAEVLRRAHSVAH